MKDLENGSILRAQTRFSTIIVSGVSCVVIIWFIAEHVNPRFARAMILEHGPVQWAQFVFWIAAFISGCLVANRFRRSDRPLQLKLMILVTSFCLFVGMEEINWGYELLGGEVPELIKEINAQQSVSIHNLEVFQPFRSLALFLLSLTMVTWGLCGATGVAKTGPLATFKLDHATTLLALLAAVSSVPTAMSAKLEFKPLLHAEIGEFLISAAFFCWTYGLVCITRSDAKHRNL